MAREVLTDRFIRSRKPAQRRTDQREARDDYRDALVPGLALRVTEKGHKSFVLTARYPSHPNNPTRRAIGTYGAIGLEDARAKARRWLELIGKGIDPKIEAAREKAAAQRRQANSFAAVAGEFLERHASKLRKSVEARRIIDQEFVKRWGERPIADIMPEEVAAAIRAIVKRDAPAQARNALGYIRKLYNWAMGTHEFGLALSPVAALKTADLVGAKKARERVLIDAELRAVWNAAGEMGFPYGPLFRLLILTGQREREVADMQWGEVDLSNRLWTIPSARMKGGRTHETPLAPMAAEIIGSLPRFTGDYVFTTTGGGKPVNGFAKAKVRIDRLSGIAGWVIHDLRRTMRTRLSALPVEDLVRELVIAHAKSGLHKVYDQHAYQAEKRRCLELWEARLLSIVEPPPEGQNVLPIRTGAR